MIDYFYDGACVHGCAESYEKTEEKQHQWEAFFGLESRSIKAKNPVGIVMPKSRNLVTHQALGAAR